jgi:soluble lytic murein transglycosylase-like protein
MLASLGGAVLMYFICLHGGLSVQCSAGIKDIKFSDEIFLASKIHDLDPALITAVIHAESNFKHRAISFAGAKGLMQINPPTQRYLRVKNVYDPFENISAGTKYLKELIDAFDGDVILALAAYNAGPGTVRKYNGIPPYQETRKYVKKVMAFFHQYKQSFISATLAS